MKGRIFTLLKTLSIVYLLYFLCRLIFFIFQLSKFHDCSTLQIIKAFFAGTLIDTVAIFYGNILYIFILSLPFNHLKHKAVQIVTKVIFVVTNSLAIALNMIDVAYYDYSQRRTGDEILITAQNTGDLVSSYLTDFWYIILIFLSLIGTLIYFITKTAFTNVSLSGTKNKIIGLISFLTIIGASILAMRGGFFRTPLLTQDAGKFVDARLVSLATNTPHQLISTIQTENIKEYKFMSEEKAEKIFNPYLHYSNLTFQKKNVVILILESFDKEYIGYYNQGKGYTPFLDSIISQSISFEQSYANGSTSIEAPPAILSSIPSLMNDSYINSQYNTNRLSGIGEILTKEGYTTGFYHGGENGTMNFDAFVGITNFGKYYGLTQYPDKNQSDGHWGIPDEPYLQYFANELNKSKMPFCNVVFTLSSHHPYTVPVQYKNSLPEGTMPIHKAIAYTDLSLRKFFQTIKYYDWYKNTIFVITADHTSITEKENYRNYAGDYCVPILFYGNDIKASVVKNKIMQHKDIMPSLLYLLGYNKKFFSLGNNIFDPSQNGFSITYRNGTYSYCTPRYHVETNLTPIDDDGRFFKNETINPQTLDSLDNSFKAYIQVYQNRIVGNKLF